MSMTSKNNIYLVTFDDGKDKKKGDEFKLNAI